MCQPRVGAANQMFSLWRALWRPTAPASRIKSRRTAEESRTSSFYSNFLQLHCLLSTKLLSKQSSHLIFKKVFFGRCRHLVEKYSVTWVSSISGLENDVLSQDKLNKIKVNENHEIFEDHGQHENPRRKNMRSLCKYVWNT
jgi:hypothetical protein